MMPRLVPSLLAVVALLLLPGQAAPATYREPTTHAALVSSRATSSPLDLVSQLSTCAISCLLTHSPEYGCSVVDIECQCASAPLYEALSACMVMNCTLDEAVGLAKVDAKQCNRPSDSKNGEFVRIYYAFSFFIYTLFALRMVTRAFITKTLWWDDFFHFVAIVITFFITYCVGQLVELGFGKHLYQVEPSSLQTFWMWSYIGQLLWATCILALKVSVLCFDLHLFPDRKFKLACSVVLGVMVVGGTGFILLDVLQCMPVSAGWTLQHGADAKCIKLSTVAISGAAFNVLSEIAIFILPMPVLATLQLKLRKKIGVIILLGLGLITIIIALVRIRFLMGVDGYADDTYRLYPGFQWTAIEVLAAHFVVSAPAILALLKAVHGYLKTAVRNSAYLGGSQSSKEKAEVSFDSSPTEGPPAPRPTTPTPPTPLSPFSSPRRQGEYDMYGGYDFDDEDDDDELELRRSVSSYVTASSVITTPSSARASFGSTESEGQWVETGSHVAK